MRSLRPAPHLLWKEESRKKIVDPEDLPKVVAEIRASGDLIATLNGSFDVLHAGHLQIIYEASLQADCLIVALNSDLSISRLKGPKRPIVSLEYRMQMMAAFEFVDYVTWFDELDPRRILSLINPDIHVNGAEYTKDCIEKDVIKKLYLVDKIPGLSTSFLIQRILDAYRS